MFEVMNYIDFNGNAKEAVDFYIHAFDVKDARITLFKDLPSNASRLSPENENKIAHANLKLGTFTLMISDTQPENPVKIGENFTFFLVFDNLIEEQKVYERLRQNARIIIPMGEQFWSKSYAYLIDAFGIGWQLSCEEQS